MKKIGLVLIALISTCMVFGNEPVSVGILNGPSSIPAGYMIENVTSINETDVSFEKFADPKALLPKLIKKEVDIGFLPVNVAAKVFNSSNGAVICCGITGNGNISLVTKDDNINSLSDLKGKKVHVAGQGATPDYLFRYLLSENGILVGDSSEGVELDFSIPTAQLPAYILSNKIDYAVVPEPFISVMELKSKDINVPIDFQAEYKSATGKDSEYPLTVMVATRDFVLKHGDLLKSFLSEYEKSVKWTVENPAAAGGLSEKHSLGFNKAVASKAIPKSNYCFVYAEDSKDIIEKFLGLFLEYAPASIGGKLPSNNFYFYGK